MKILNKFGKRIRKLEKHLKKCGEKMEKKAGETEELQKQQYRLGKHLENGHVDEIEKTEDNIIWYVIFSFYNGTVARGLIHDNHFRASHCFILKNSLLYSVKKTLIFISIIFSSNYEFAVLVLSLFVTFS